MLIFFFFTLSTLIPQMLNDPEKVLFNISNFAILRLQVFIIKP